VGCVGVAAFEPHAAIVAAEAMSAPARKNRTNLLIPANSPSFPQQSLRTLPETTLIYNQNDRFAIYYGEMCAAIITEYF
jgi:hypothetical protein